MAPIADVLLRFLAERTGLFYCWACLAKGTGLTAFDRSFAWVDLVTHRRTEFTQAQCVVCLQVRTVVRAKT